MRKLPEARLVVWLIRASFRDQPWHWIVASLSVALGLALAVSIHLVNQSAVEAMNNAVKALSGEAQAQLLPRHSNREGFSDRVFDVLLSHRERLGLLDASPVVKGRIQDLDVLGIDLFRAAVVNRSLLPSAEETGLLNLLSEEALFLSQQALIRLNLERDDVLVYQSKQGPVNLRIAGMLASSGDVALGLIDIASAQRIFERLNQLDRIDLRLSEGQSVEGFQDALNSLARQEPLLKGLVVLTPKNQESQLNNLSRAYRVNLSVLALVALLTGAFLIHSAVRLSTLRQQQQLALLAVLGARPWVIRGIALLKAMLIAGLGGILGLVLGVLLAAGLLGTVGADLGAGYFAEQDTLLWLTPMSLLGFLALALGLGLLSGIGPSLQALGDSPVRSLHWGAVQAIRVSQRQRWLALLLSLVGLAAMAAPAVHGLALAAYAGIACLLFAAVLLVPDVVRLGVSLAFLFGVHGSSSRSMAVWRLRQAPAASTAIGAGIVAAVALTIAMAIMVTSFRVSLSTWLDQVLPADLYVSTRDLPSHARLQKEELTGLRATPEIRRLHASLQTSLRLSNELPAVTFIARDFHEVEPRAVLPIIEDLQNARSEVSSNTMILGTASGPGRNEMNAWASEAMAHLYNWRLGASVELPLTKSDGTMVMARVLVVGFIRDYGRQHGTIIVNRDDYLSLTGDTRVTGLSIWLKPQANAAGLVNDLMQRPGIWPELRYASTLELRKLSLEIFDRSFALTYALEFAALIVALVAVVSGSAAQMLLRQKEFALLQQLGQSSGQRLRMVAWEAFGLIGSVTLWGLALGLGIGLILIHIVNPQSFHWTMQLSIPGPELAGFLLVVLLLSVGASVLTAYRSLHNKGQSLYLELRKDW